MRIKESLNTKGITGAATKELIKKGPTIRALNAMERKSMVGDVNGNSCVDSSFLSTMFFPAPASSQTKLNNNNQKQHGRGCGVILPSYHLPNFPTKNS
jgi:hypothetical protein